jgi:lysyl-tRNA synthetase class 2
MTGHAPDVHPLEAQRRANREAIRALGFAPYGSRTDGLIALADARAMHSPQADEEHARRSKEPGWVDPRPRVKVAGRVILLRDTGKLVWMNLRDHTGDLQIAVSQRDVPDADFRLAKLTDLADLLVVEGRLMRTRTGEITVWVERLRPAAKALIPPPAKHEGLVDVEIRYRQRYVDLWANPETLAVFETRSRLISNLRRLLDARGYMEVETPMLQMLPGGAAARPFQTHMNALDMPLYLRIAPELYLKRLLVGGMPRVYEINRNFRNEGLDRQHNPEFTMLEAYHAHGDVETVMELTEYLVRESARRVARDRGLPAADGELRLPFGEWSIDYGSPFRRVRYPDLFQQALGFSMWETERVLDEAARRGIRHAGVDPIVVVNDLFEAFAEPMLDPSRPTFITDYPAALSPLTRPKEGDARLADRADLFIARMEIAPHYTELNDPDVQEAKFREQLRGGDADTDAEERTFRTFDADFIRALKVGMPPAGGMGLGVDRLVMLLTDQRSIRDVMLFPMMRPEASHSA